MLRRAPHSIPRNSQHDMAEVKSMATRRPPDSQVRRAVLRAALCGLALAPVLSVRAQPMSGMRRVGFLAPGSSRTRVYEGFRRGMRELGHVDGKTIDVQWRFADGNYARLAAFAGEIVRSNVEVIVAGTTLSVQATQRATASLPIVMVAVPDPVGEGFATSLSHPGGTITGLSNIVTEVSVKHVELLRAALPKLSRLAVLINPQNPSDSLILEQVNGAAYARGLKVVAVEASTESQIDTGFAAMARAQTEALVVAEDAFFDVQADRITKLALKHRLPTITSNREMTEAGALMSYGQDLTDHYRRAAVYVDKILKGAKPGDLPIEQPTVLELVINRGASAALGMAIPQELLLRADRFIG
jgi:putative ABC transport system substrate-binding protein